MVLYLKIQEDDFLPQRICTACSNSISSACEIKKKCIESDRLLKNGFKLEFPLYEPVLSIEHQEPTMFCASMIEERLEIEEPTSANLSDKKPAQPSKPKRILSVSTPVNPQSSTKPCIEDKTCVFCEASFVTITDKKRHMKIEHPTEVVCTFCHKKRASVFAAEKCIRDHRYGFPFLCTMCAKGFRSKYDLKEHEDVMHLGGLLFCDKCGFKTKYKTNIVSHIMRIHLSIANKNFPCPHESCPGLFYSKRNALNIHLYRYHNVQAPVTCNVCSFGFTTESELRCHRTRCSGAPSAKKSGRNQRSLKPFYDEGSDGRLHCKLCSKSYDSKQSFAVHHIMKHRDNKTCAVCNKTFSTACSYYNHYKVVHLKIKKYHCEHLGCGKSFGSKFILNNHKNTHTGKV